MKVWSTEPDAGQIVLAKVDDSTSRVTEAWTGPQVAWTMARGAKGSFGRKINDGRIWWPLAAVFFLGLANLRRPLSMRNLDLLVLLSFSASWWFFNEGEIFTSVPLAYPPLVYLLLRMAWVGLRGARESRRRTGRSGPCGSRCADDLHRRLQDRPQRRGLERHRRRLRGGHRRAANRRRGRDALTATCPYTRARSAGRPDSNGNVRDRIQTNGRCESANDRGDTYGPINYIAYIPGYLAYGWSGKWDDLPAAHFSALLFDSLTLIGLALVGWRFGRARLAATLSFAWVAYPFTQYVSSSNANDALRPCLLIWGFWLVSSAPARGLFVGLASWAKFAGASCSCPSGLRIRTGSNALAPSCSSQAAF